MEAIAKQIISTYIKRIRSAKASQSVSCIVGKGWTIATSDGLQQLSKNDDGTFGITGTWNNKSVYYEKEVAKAGLKEIKAKLPNGGEGWTIKHIFDLRDRQLEKAIEMFKVIWPNRNAC